MTPDKPDVPQGAVLVPVSPTRTSGPKAWAVVSQEDAPRVRSHVWTLHPTGYACRHVELARDRFGRRRRTVYLHRYVLDADDVPGQVVVDHVNRDRLDCRRENLRFLPPGLNAWANQQRHRDTTH